MDYNIQCDKLKEVYEKCPFLFVKMEGKQYLNFIDNLNGGAFFNGEGWGLNEERDFYTSTRSAVTHIIGQPEDSSCSKIKQGVWTELTDEQRQSVLDLFKKFYNEWQEVKPTSFPYIFPINAIDTMFWGPSNEGPYIADRIMEQICKDFQDKAEELCKQRQKAGNEDYAGWGGPFEPDLAWGRIRYKRNYKEAYDYVQNNLNQGLYSSNASNQTSAQNQNEKNRPVTTQLAVNQQNPEEENDGVDDDVTPIKVEVSKEESDEQNTADSEDTGKKQENTAATESGTRDVIGDNPYNYNNLPNGVNPLALNGQPVPNETANANTELQNVPIDNVGNNPTTETSINPTAAAEAQKNWFQRNCELLIGILAAIAVAVGSYFIFRKEKNKTKSAKAEAAALSAKVGDLKSQLSDLTQIWEENNNRPDNSEKPDAGNTDNNPSDNGSTDNDNSDNTGGSTLGNSSSSVEMGRLTKIVIRRTSSTERE